MPAVFAFVGAVVGGVGATVAAVASAIGTAIAGIASAIGGAIAGIASSIGGSLTAALGNISAFVSSVGYYFTEGLAFNLASIGGTIARAAYGISAVLNSAIVKITLPIMTVVNFWKSSFIGRLSGAYTVIDEAATAILTPVKETLEMVKGVVDTIKEPVETVTSTAAQIRKTISDITSLKIVDEMLKNTGDISDLLEPIANAKSVETATAIATLARGIVGTTVATMDKIDSEFELLGATIDTFDERLRTTIKEKVALAKVEVLAVVTPKLDALGAGQEKVTRGITRIYRHLEDVPWFMWMLARALR